jgi:hypothetical protein
LALNSTLEDESKSRKAENNDYSKSLKVSAVDKGGSGEQQLRDLSNNGGDFQIYKRLIIHMFRYIGDRIFKINYVLLDKQAVTKAIYHVILFIEFI